MTEASLKSSPLFRSLPPQEFAGLLQALRKNEFADGEIVCREGDVGDRVYIIETGELDILSAYETLEENLIATHGPGNIVGEMSLLVPEGRRTATVRANGDVTLFELRLDDFEAMLESSPIMAYRILQELGTRLNRASTDLQEKNRELIKALEELKAAQAEIVKKEKMEHELSMARDIQQSILPQEMPQFMGVDLGARMVPALEVGGDFYDFIPLDDHRLGVAIGDVSNKGVPAGLFMAQFSTLLRLQARQIRNPRNVLSEINYHLLRVNKAGLFVTAIYGVYETSSRVFTYARAGHEIPLLFDPGGNVCEPEHGRGVPMGLFPDPILDVQSVEVPAGHTLLMYTDGGTDAMNVEQNTLGLERLKEMAASRLGERCQAMCDGMVEELAAYQGEGDQYDDITLVALRAFE